MAPNLQERVSVAEVEIDHLEQKIDQVQNNLKEFRTEITDKLTEMQEASTKQHGELAQKIGNLEKLKDRWIAWVIGAAFAAEIILQNWNQISHLLGK